MFHMYRDLILDWKEKIYIYWTDNILILEPSKESEFLQDQNYQTQQNQVFWPTLSISNNWALPLIGT
jgi:hypothetical protein